MSLLSILRAAPDRFMSGAEIARVAGLTRAAIWKQVEELRTRGYTVDAQPHRGYRLIDGPDRPYPEEVQEGLATEVFGRRALYLKTASSTNDEAKRLGAAGWPEGAVIVAEEQTAGRGRLGRRWSSAAGGLWFSLIARPALALANLGPLTIVAAVALCRAILAETGAKPAIKWPNDLVLGGRKLAGILAEASGELGRAELVVLGLGLNVNQSAADFPPELRMRATSLRLCLGREVRRLPILRAFLAAFEELYLGGRGDGFRSALAEATANSATLGRQVQVACGGATLAGLAVRLDPDGALVLETESGPVRVMTGETEEVAR